VNSIKKWILTALGYICPKCGGRMEVRLPCSHGWGSVTCENWFSGECGNRKMYRGESVSTVSFKINELCPCCGNFLAVEIENGIEKKFCRACGKVEI
jgi:hypothetical protein